MKPFQMAGKFLNDPHLLTNWIVLRNVLEVLVNGEHYRE